MNQNYKVIEGLEKRRFDEKDFLNVNTPVEYKELEEI